MMPFTRSTAAQGVAVLFDVVVVGIREGEIVSQQPAPEMIGRAQRLANRRHAVMVLLQCGGEFLDIRPPRAFSEAREDMLTMKQNLATYFPPVGLVGRLEQRGRIMPSYTTTESPSDWVTNAATFSKSA